MRTALRLFVLIDLMVHWSGRFSLFGFCFLNSYARMCAGSLAPGCGILGIFATRSQVHGAWVSFGMLGASTLASWGPWEPFWHLGSTLDHFGTSGPHWSTLGAAGWTRGIQNGSFIDDGKHSPSDWSYSGKALAC